MSLTRTIALVIALWLPVQGYVTAGEAFCLRQSDAGAAEVAHGAATGMHDSDHACCEPEIADSDVADQHSPDNCCKTCVGTAMVVSNAFPAFQAQSTKIVFVPTSQSRFAVNIPLRPPSIALA